jgi:glycosyltransferase involved in cell wall biosynthesis
MSHHDKALLELLYSLILKRKGDPEGMRHFSKQLGWGMHPLFVARSMLNSHEYNIRIASRQAEPTHTEIPVTPATVEDILKASETHFSCPIFLSKLSTGSFPAHGRPVEHIGVYYHRMFNGGTERVTALQIQMWRKMGYRVTLLSDVPNNPEKDYHYGHGIRRFVLPRRMMYNRGYRRRGVRLANLLMEEKIDVFVTNQWYEISTIWDVLIARSLGIPAVVGWHNCFNAGLGDTDDLPNAHLRYIGFRHATLLAVLSSVDKLWFNNLAIPSRLIPNPLTFAAHDAGSQSGSKREKYSLVWIGRVERHQKRVDLLIRMFALLLSTHPQAHLTIIGEGPDLEWSQHYAESLNINHRVSFVGYTKDISRYLETSSIHVMTSEFEGYPMVLGEVWSHGVPTVMFALPHLEICRPKLGYTAVPQGDIASMAKAISNLLGNGSTRDKLAHEALGIAQRLSESNAEIEAAWKSVFDSISARSTFAIQPLSDDDIETAHLLIGMLRDTLFSVTPEKQGARSTSNRIPPLQPRRDTPRYKELASIVTLPVAASLKLARHTFRFFASIRSVLLSDTLSSTSKGRLKPTRAYSPSAQLAVVDLSQVGLGDNLMLWHGLFTLLDNNVKVCAKDCAIFVPPPLEHFANALFHRFGLNIVPGSPQTHRHPYFTPLPPKGFGQWIRALFGRDWYMTWVEALDQQKTFPRSGRRQSSIRFRIWLYLSDLTIYGRLGWRHAIPSYVGYRVWLPLAIRNAVYPVLFMSQMKRSLQTMRQIAAEYVDRITPVEERRLYAGNAAFPVGKSFQTIPPQLHQAILAAAAPLRFTTYVQQDSAWHPEYAAALVPLRELATIEDALRVTKYADKLLTTDSFTSHIAQLLRDDFTLILTRDIREQVVHPAANPNVVANHPPCAPCNYQERFDFEHCLAGYRYCSAFSDPSFIRTIADTLLDLRR